MIRTNSILSHFLPGRENFSISTKRINPFLETKNTSNTTYYNASSSTPSPTVESSTTFIDPFFKDMEFLNGHLFRILRSQEGDSLAESVKELIEASREYQIKGDENSFEQVVSKVNNMLEHNENPSSSSSSSSPSASSLVPLHVLNVARAFDVALSLQNVAESHHRIRRWRSYLKGQGELALKQQPEDVYPTLLKNGFKPNQIRKRQSEQITDFVLTAHPTESKRRTLLAKYQRIATLLGVRDRTDLTPNSIRHLELEFEREILACWHSNTVRRNRPSAIDEARGGLSVVEDVLFYAVPVFLQSIDDSLVKIGADPLDCDCSTIRISSWIGGDRYKHERHKKNISEIK
jgi:phosphoenolpyruvate carboxylase